MKLLKKIMIMLMLMAFTIMVSLGVTAFATESSGTNLAGEFVDRSGQVTRVDIPNGDGTFTALEGEEAQAWYVRAVAEGEQRLSQEAKLENSRAGDEREVELAIYLLYVVIIALAIVILIKQNKQATNENKS